MCGSFKIPGMYRIQGLALLFDLLTVTIKAVLSFRTLGTKHLAHHQIGRI